MIRWFKLKQSTTYEWRSKASQRWYQFFGDTIVPVENVQDQERFLRMDKQFVEVDERGNTLDRQTGQVLPPAFSRKGMVGPRSYTKITRTSTAEESPKPDTSPRRIISGKRPAGATPAERPVVVPPVKEVQEVKEPPAEAELKGASDSPESSDSSDVVSESGARKRRVKRSSKKSGRKSNE